jgi:hypothetical protein
MSEYWQAWQFWLYSSILFLSWLNWCSWWVAGIATKSTWILIIMWDESSIHHVYRIYFADEITVILGQSAVLLEFIRWCCFADLELVLLFFYGWLCLVFLVIISVFNILFLLCWPTRIQKLMRQPFISTRRLFCHSFSNESNKTRLVSTLSVGLKNTHCR